MGRRKRGVHQNVFDTRRGDVSGDDGGAHVDLRTTLKRRVCCLLRPFTFFYANKTVYFCVPKKPQFSRAALPPMTRDTIWVVCLVYTMGGVVVCSYSTYVSYRTGDLLRIERSRTEGRVKLSDLKGPDPILGEAVAQREAGEPGTPPPAEHAAYVATTPWRIDIRPLQHNYAELGQEGAESNDQETEETERCMVLYNVAAGTELHVR